MLYTVTTVRLNLLNLTLIFILPGIIFSLSIYLQNAGRNSQHEVDQNDNNADDENQSNRRIIRFNVLDPKIRDLELEFNTQSTADLIQLPTTDIRTTDSLVPFPNYSTSIQQANQPNESYSSENLDMICKMPHEIGTGTFRIPRWYYNDITGRCESFYYSGQGGNENNFATFETCQMLCEVNPCMQPRDSGTGKGQIKRYYFNLYNRVCEPFEWTGAGGNRNNFANLESCRKSCPEYPNPCNFGLPLSSATGEYFHCGPSEYYETECPVNYFCHLGLSTETTVCCPEEEGTGHRCSSPLMIGVGGHLLQRWFFDETSEECKLFFYRGLRGNENNFATKVECENTCFDGLPYSNKDSIVKCQTDEDCPSQHYCHQGLEEQTTVCCLSKAGNPCDLPLAEGKGKWQITRWYFDSSVRNCRQFIYKGRKGNQNNFRNLSQCEAVCSMAGPMISCTQTHACPSNFWCHIGSTASSTVCCPGAVQGTAICQQPLQIGTGQTPVTRWYYNPTVGQCMPFQYSGMRGNQNNFISKEECERMCMTSINACPVGSPLLSGTRPRFCNNVEQPCPSGYWCHVGATPDAVMCCPGDKSAACELPYSVGVGIASLNRWYFNHANRTCLPFFYKGLYGNQNNFLSKQDCENTCLAGSGIDPCQQPLEFGSGSTNIPRWYYNSATGQCSPFAYRGLYGNENNFLTKLDCDNACTGEPIKDSYGRQLTCGVNRPPCPEESWCHVGSEIKTTVCCPGRAKDPCVLPLVYGQGSGNLTRFYYNEITDQCVQFHYGGLAGNENNFLSKQQCEQRCAQMNPCPMGFPAAEINGQRLQCGPRQPPCPRNYWCHVGSSPKTTACCPADSVTNPCMLPVSPGTGNERLERYAYNVDSSTCTIFIYYGTKGNANNFSTKEDCERRCLGKHIPQSLKPTDQCIPLCFSAARTEESTVNPCAEGQPAKNAVGLPLQCTGDATSTSCPIGYWCHFGASPSTTLCCPGVVTNVCELPVVFGVGTSQLVRYYYDRKSNQCLQFTYGGSKGNQNNFKTFNECEKTCSAFLNPCPQGLPAVNGFTGQQLHCTADGATCPLGYWCHYGLEQKTQVCCPGAVSDVCKLSINSGVGSAMSTRYGFNTLTSECERFEFRGAKGNQNNFLTLEDCIKACGKIIPTNPCPFGTPKQDPESGKFVHCIAAYGETTCGENYWCHIGANDDTTLCCPGKVTNPCTLPVEKGKGTSSLNRWYFNAEMDECSMFFYRGMAGNQNNFLTQDECEHICTAEKKNPCPAGVPQTDAQHRVVKCTFESGCREGFWCHLGATPDTTLCCPGSSQSVCNFFNADSGQGGFTLQRWYFDVTSGECRQFIYHGLKGNPNNFLSKEDCEKTCLPFTNPCPSGDVLLDVNNRPQTCNALSTSASCPAGYWCHVGASIENTVCCPGTQDACVLPLSTGVGNAMLPRWYYEPNTKRCVQFTYRGSKGNQNNFLSAEACRLACREFRNPCIGQPAKSAIGQLVFCSANNKENCPVNYWCHVGDSSETTMCCPGATNPCSVPLSPGTGSSSLQRWYYNADSRTCISFTYNGMGGNQNNFLSKANCEEICPVWRSPCLFDATPALIDSTNQLVRCNPMKFSGCPANYWCHPGRSLIDTVCCPTGLDDLRLETETILQIHFHIYPETSQDRCSLPKQSGTGEYKLPRWYYNAKDGRCKRFRYAGRYGNQNNFMSKEFCSIACEKSSNPCSNGQSILYKAEQNIFPCDNAYNCPRDYYCLHGVGDGICCPEKDKPCSLPMTEGEGIEILRRWFYDNTSDKCLIFFYRGSKGNMNNFRTKEDCEKTCIAGKCSLYTSRIRCLEKKVVGTGNAHLERWHFSSEKAKCINFVYSGLGGNGNNFATKADCEQTCREYQTLCPWSNFPLVANETLFFCDNDIFCPPTYVCHKNARRVYSVCCPDPAHFCRLPLDSGTCEENNLRYGYNEDSHSCVLYRYGGCGGNLNRFETVEECLRVCLDEYRHRFQ
ncbi:Papilin [Trichinella murrelli]|uniref:Papilin n=1 Tax=Trichinella murrelli TaxID=144512 RepID=A0A0V0UBT2_9BILA|nr:Papilin [Trichinella murrelli]